MRILLKIVFLGLILGSIHESAIGQSKTFKSPTKKSKAKEKPDFWRESMWYGGGINLSLYSTELTAGVPGNIFEFGLSPIAGYKIKPWLSAGPRFEFNYIGGKFQYSPKILKLNGFNYGAGIFARAKFLKAVFAHVEYSSISTLSLTGNIINNKLETERNFKDHFFLGLGYNPPSEFSYEFYILYDFLADKNSTQLPIQYRAGLTYNF